MILTTLVAAIALGIFSQILAERFQIPAILPLLSLGILCGPAGLAVFSPAALGEEMLTVLVHLGVAIILFEGGLTLDPRRLWEVGGPVRNLLTVGMTITAVASAACAHWVLGISWPTAALFGAVMTVTGPTVIVPLLRHLIAPREVKTLLLSEGLLIDPMGAVLAYVVLQWTERAGIPPRELIGELAALALVGTILGFAAGALAKLVVRTRLVSGELRNLTILAILMLCYLLAEGEAHQSGILAAMVMGFTMSAAELPDLVSVKAFKGQLTTLVISTLFILLAGSLDLQSILDLGWRGLAVVVLLIAIVRPLAVFASVWPSHMGLRERGVVALTAPRGIVAAAVASLAARHMADLGVPGGEILEGLVYLGILVTGAWATLMAVILPRLFGYADDAGRRRVVLVGANALTEVLARQLERTGRTVVIIDSSSWRLDHFRALKLATVRGDARDATTYEEAGVERDSLVLVLTTNDELNLLVADLVHTEFGVEHPVVALQRPPEDFGRRSRAWMDLLGDGGIEVASWVKQLENGQCEVVDIAVDEPAAGARLRELERDYKGRLAAVMAWRGDEPIFRVHEVQVDDGVEVVVLAGKGPALEEVRKISESATAGDDAEVNAEPVTDC